VPRADVVGDALVPTDRTSHSPSRRNAELFDVRVGDRTAVDGALTYPEPALPELRDTVRFDWSKMDSWFEEDEEVYTHPRDPHVRVDILASSRRVRIELDGVTLADSVRPR